MQAIATRKKKLLVAITDKDPVELVFTPFVVAGGGGHRY